MIVRDLRGYFGAVPASGPTPPTPITAQLPPNWNDTLVDAYGPPGTVVGVPPAPEPYPTWRAGSQSTLPPGFTKGIADTIKGVTGVGDGPLGLPWWVVIVGGVAVVGGGIFLTTKLKSKKSKRR